MGRMVKDALLQSIEARSKLKVRHEPYWRLIAEGVHLGYRKGKRGGVWIGRVREGAGYRKQVLGNANDVIEATKENYLTFSEAQKSVATLLSDRPIPTEYDVGEAVARYLAWFKINRKSAKVTETVINAHILPSWKSVKLSDLRAEAIKAWHQKLATKPARKRVRSGQAVAYREAPTDDDAKRARKSTANRVLTVFKAVLNKAFEDELVQSHDAWRKVKPFENTDEPIVRFLKTSEATRLINACKPDFRILVQAALNTGARFSEVTGMKVCDFSPDNLSVHVRPSKSGKGRHVPLSPEGVSIFEAASVGKKTEDLLFVRADGSAWGKNYQVRPLLAACKNARIDPPVTFHELRHTYASLLAQAGADLLTISKLLGHADTRITSRHYAHLCDKTLAIAVNRFLPSFANVKKENVTAFTKRGAKRAS